ncbi:putative LPS assembly protein LptD, partial [Segatella oris]|uniref:putative LPS assembly protein LptD n=1 Tax=Segatella oris TaxID=28135 RepID=UPI003872C8C3
MSNSINTKEDRLLRSNLIKDWRNGMQHRIPVSGNFTLFNYINVSPSFNFTNRMYTNKVTKSWNRTTQKEVSDTTYGFHNI